MALEHGGDIFAVAREHGWDWREVVDFSANINPLGPSPKVRPAICAAMDRIAHYPEREPFRLSLALAALWNVRQEQILVGNGATELIFFLARLLRNAPITLALPVFSEFHRAFPEARAASLTDPGTWPRKGMLVLSRPANPTGWTLPLDALSAHMGSSDASVLVDESFLDFSGLPSAAALIPQYPQLMVLRSLTKFYGLPGMRVGALIGAPDAVRLWKEQREPWQVNALAEVAALAAIGDVEHGARSAEFVRNERTWLTDQLRRLPGTEPLPTDANFVCARLQYPAAKLRPWLLRSKILIRDCAGWPGISGDVVRVAVRRREENQRLLDVWRKFTCD